MFRRIFLASEFNERSNYLSPVLLYFTSDMDALGVSLLLDNSGCDMNHATFVHSDICHLDTSNCATSKSVLIGQNYRGRIDQSVDVYTIIGRQRFGCPIDETIYFLLVGDGDETLP
ncbi:hypothetical protein A3711_10650 [Erythrobacter sp. HI00D59]|nr:hypothetical protein A3711_10650 [Erythrobacter sp. HI00D59]